MLSKLHSNKAYFFTFFTLIWLIVQLASNNLQVSFDEACKTADAFSYTESAKDILSGGYPWFRAAGYPLLLAPFLAFFKENTVIILFTLFQFILWLLSIRLVFSTLLEWKVSDKHSIIGTIIYSLFISTVLSTNHLLTETSYIFLLLLSLYITAKWLNNRHYKNIAFLFPVLAVSALIRPLGLNFFFLSLLIAVICLYRKNFKVIPALLLSLALLGGHIFMMKKHHNTSQICLSKNHALYHYLHMKVSHYPDMNATRYEPGFFKESAKLDSTIGNIPYFYAYRDSIYSTRNKQLFLDHKYATLKTMYVNFKDEIWEGFSNHTKANKWVYILTKTQHGIMVFSFFILAFIAVFQVIFKKLKDKNFMIWGAICFMVIAYLFLGSSLVFWYGDRIHLPAYPLLVMIATILVDRKLRSKQIPQS